MGSVQAPLVLPSGATAVYSVRQLSTYSTNKCVDVVDGASVTHTIGFVNNVCDFTTIAGLTQPVTISKIYDQSGNGHDTTTVPAANRPSINGSAAQAFLFDGLPATSLSSNIFQKYVIFPAGAAINQNSFTLFAAVTPKTSIWSNAYFSFLNGSSVAYQDIYTFQDATTNIAGRAQGVQNSASLFATTTVPAINGSVIGLVGNGTAGSAIIDGTTVATTVASQSLTANFIGDLAGFQGFAGSFDLFALALYPTALSAPNQTAVQTALQSLLPIPAAYTGQLILDGDSITFAYGGTLNQGWAGTLVKSFPNYNTLNFGIPAIQISTLSTYASSRIVPRFNSGVAKNIVVIWAGTNDVLGNSPAANIYAALQSYTATVKAAGFKVVWVTMLPRSDLTTPLQAVWNAYNALIRGATLGQSDTADVIADVQSDPTMGPFSATSNNALYCDWPGTNTVNVHPTDLGNSIVAPYIINAVGSL